MPPNNTSLLIVFYYTSLQIGNLIEKNKQYLERTKHER